MDSIEKSKQLQSEFKDCQKLLTALGDETRQHLLSIMMMEECSGCRVVEIAEKTNLSRPAVSHHMQILKDAGLVTSRKEGTCIYYMLNPDFDGMQKLMTLVSHVSRMMKEEQCERKSEE